MDRFFGTTMQKSMPGDPSGQNDTMWAMIVNAPDALAISALGGWDMTQRRHSFIEAWLHKFIECNPHVFRH